MGVPEEDHPLVRGWVREITLSLDLVRTPERIAAGSRRAGELIAYFDRLVAQHRKTPQGNLLSLLIEAHDGGSFLDEHELLACVRAVPVRRPRGVVAADRQRPVGAVEASRAVAGT